VNFSRLLVLMTTVTGLFGATGVDTFHWSGKVPAGQRLEVRGVNGSIHAEPAAGDEVEVIAFKNGREFRSRRNRRASGAARWRCHHLRCLSIERRTGQRRTVR